MSAIKAKEAACCSSAVMLYLDGELEPSRVVEVESHLSRCSGCRDHLLTARAMRASLRRSIAQRAPSALQNRLREALCDGSLTGDILTTTAPGRVRERPDRSSRGVEARPAPRATEDPARSERPRRWAVVAVAMAACFVFIVVLRSDRDGAAGHGVFDRGVATLSPSPLMQQRFYPVRAASASASSDVAPAANDEVPSLDAMLDKLVALHAHPLPPDERNPEALNRLEPYVGVPVKRQALTLLRDLGVQRASFEGARIHPVRDSKSAAALRYRMQGHSVTVYVFDPRIVSMGRTRLVPRIVRENPIYVGRMRGYSVAAVEKRGVGYALASDFDEDRSLQMVSSF
jgi:anti-sigma factor ChrR (cupin superfamily)